jgi:hypothetical protein
MEKISRLLNGNSKILTNVAFMINELFKETDIIVLITGGLLNLLILSKVNQR